MESRKLLKLHLFAVSLVSVASIVACYGILTTEGMTIYEDYTLPFSLQRFFDMHYPLWNQYGSTNSFEFVARLPFRVLPLAFATFLNLPAEIFYKIILVSTMALSGLSMYSSFFYLIKSSSNDHAIKKVFAGAIVASLIYMFNFKAIHTIIWPTLHFAYAIAPIVLVSFIKLTLTHEFKYAFLTAVLTALIAGSPHYFVFVGSLMVSWLAYYVLISRFALVRLNSLRAVTFFVIFALLFNSFWLLPFAQAALTGNMPSPSYIIASEVLALLSRNSAISDTLRLTDIWWKHSSLAPENTILQQLWILATYALPLFAFLSLIVSKKEHRQYTIFFGAISILFVLLATGTKVFPDLYCWLTFNLPFGWLLRAPNKLTMIVAMTYSFLCGVTLTSIFDYDWKRVAVAAMVFLALFGGSITPMATGYLYNVFTPVRIPLEYYETNDFISNTGEYKALWLPLGYRGTVSWAPGKLVGPIDIRSSSVPTIGSLYPNSKNYLGYVAHTLLENKSRKISDFISVLNVKYILFHDDTSEYSSIAVYRLIGEQDSVELLKKDGYIYIFENSNVSDYVNIPSNDIILTGGLDRFSSLTAIDSFNPEDSSLIFLDQLSLGRGAYEYFLKGSIIIGDINNLDLLVSLSEGVLLIEPFDATTHSEPSTFWSRTAPSDDWHNYLKGRNIENWDFDYGKGFVFVGQTAENPVSLTIPITLERTDDYVFLARCFENQAGGELEIHLNDHNYTVSTKNQANKFVWREIDTVHLEKGIYEINLTSKEGLNAVNVFSLVSQNEFLRSQNLLGEILQEKTFVHLLEDSDIYYENSTLRRECGVETSNGDVLILNENSSVWQDVVIPKSSNYRFVIKSQGMLEIRIDGVMFLKNSSSMDWNYSDSIFLDAGLHKIEITTPTNAELDVALLYSLKDLDEKLEDVFAATQSPAEILDYSLVDPTKCWVEVNATEPFTLAFAEAYDPLWSASVNGEKFSSIPLYGVINGFCINQTGVLEVLIEYEPQKWFYLGAIISLGAFLACIAYSFWPLVRKRWKFQELVEKAKLLFSFG